MLEKVIEAKKKRVEEQKTVVPIKIIKNRASLASATRNFRQALIGKDLCIIGEIKKASPSAGNLALDLNPKEIAKIYEDGGVSAISVLTEQDFFKGELKYIKDVKSVVSLPILRKDFIFEEYQVYESRVVGADAILLIATLLDENTLKSLAELSKKLRMEPLIEVHTRKDLEKALKIDVKVIGINNRDLKTFNVDVNTTKRLISEIGPGKIIVSESGIKERADAQELKKLGVDAILVGETLVRSENISEKLESLKV